MTVGGSLFRDRDIIGRWLSQKTLVLHIVLRNTSKHLRREDIDRAVMNRSRPDVRKSLFMPINGVLLSMRLASCLMGGGQAKWRRTRTSYMIPSIYLSAITLGGRSSLW